MKNEVIRKKDCSQLCCGLCCTKVENLGVTIGSLEILKDINLHIHCGELTAIIGPNGAGKSTLIKALLGQVPHTGKLKFTKEDGSSYKPPVMGYVPQNISLDPTSPTSVMDLFLSSGSSWPVWLVKPRRKIAEIRERLKKVKADHLIDRRLGKLSGGELQRVLLALALDPVPEILLLDEPVSGIDQNGLELFYENVSALRKAYDLSIILVSHDMDMVNKYADRVILLNKTIIADGPPYKVLESDSFYDVFSMKLQKNKRQEGEEH
ncbi:MAG: metal ABC transporter ATP-binding protein [Clostridiaceae bacterium]|nr:metal ABC transporter ATP-binding protein [Clostridiaceae bacterium]